MTKTPMWGNARLILNVHLEHNTLKIYKKFILFSLDIFEDPAYRECGASRSSRLEVFSHSAGKYYS